MTDRPAEIAGSDAGPRRRLRGMRRPAPGPATWAVALGVLAAWPWPLDLPSAITRGVAVWFVAAMLLPGARQATLDAIGAGRSPSRLTGAMEGMEAETGGVWIRIIASLAIAALLGSSALIWTALLWLVLGLAPLPLPLDRLPEGLRSILTRLRRPDGRWRVLWAWLGPTLLAWLALGGDVGLPADARLALSPLAQLWEWARANALWPLVAAGLLLPLGLAAWVPSVEGGPSGVASGADDVERSVAQDRARTNLASRLSIGGWLIALLILAASDHASAAMGGAMLLAAAWPALVDPAMPRDMVRRRVSVLSGLALALAAMVL